MLLVPVQDAGGMPQAQRELEAETLLRVPEVDPEHGADAIERVPERVDVQA